MPTRRYRTEEAAQKRIAYAIPSTVGTEQDGDGNTIDLTDEEKAAKKQELQDILDAAKRGRRPEGSRGRGQ
ncbi:MAG: hypothetical protein V8Q27_00560 [Eubacteriales bacterium]